MQVAVRETTNARKAAKTITWTATEWRKANAPAWRGGAAGEQDGDDDDDVDDDDSDDRSQPVPEEAYRRRGGRGGVGPSHGGVEGWKLQRHTPGEAANPPR